MTADITKRKQPQSVEPTRENRPVVYPVVNVHETDDGYDVKASLPGVAESDVTLSVENRTLTIEAINTAAVPEGYTTLRQEFGPVRYRRVFELPDHVDADGITAALAQGVLTVKLPKREEVKPRRIAVKAA